LILSDGISVLVRSYLIDVFTCLQQELLKGKRGKDEITENHNI